MKRLPSYSTWVSVSEARSARVSGQDAHGAAPADSGDAVLQLLFQHQSQEAAADVAADGLVEFVINRPR